MMHLTNLGQNKMDAILKMKMLNVFSEWKDLINVSS